MYANYCQDERSMNAYVGWSTRLARLHQRTLRIFQENRDMHREDEENEEAKAVEGSCSKCRGGSLEEEDKNASTFPHIQDLCPTDKKRVAQLVKQLLK
ncbi:hypothetical protein KM043_000389 [Ampulex compressa]|nr:hypothetical protein KM043_000389 [Ampulex compressa]